MAKTKKKPLEKATFGKSKLTTPKKTRKLSAAVGSLLSETSPLVSTPSTVSSRSSSDWSSASSPSSSSAVSKSPSVSSTTSNVRKRLVLDNDDHRANAKIKYQEPKLSSLSAVSKSSSISSTASKPRKTLVVDIVDHHTNTKLKYQEPQLAAYNVDWLDSSATKTECMKHTSIKNLPDTQEGQISFLLSKFEASDIKTAFAYAVGRVGNAAREVFYPLPVRKEKLIKNFLELIFDGKSIMVDNKKDSFRYDL